ncbi:MAG: AAA family ATPase, partial [Bacilli bacterium]|nr:AAA family ATPase [Bacilli bacterium]
MEELITNAIVHKDYEKGRPIQIYVTNDGVDIINYNKPLPPLSAADLNARTLFQERDFINPEIREMFKD